MMRGGCVCRRVLELVLVGLVMQAAGCSKSPSSGASPAALAVSNSYLEAALLDVLDRPEPVLRLAEPGTCPGHYDIRPGQVDGLRRCRALFRFDFQTALDGKLTAVTEDGLKVREIRVSGGLCEPTSYLSACRQVADALVADAFLDAVAAETRVAAIRERVEARAAGCRERIASAGWSDRAVVCSGHQEAFCNWLGLKVAATFSGADSASIGQIEEAIHAGDSSTVAAVIANQPEGRRLADALGKRLNAPVVMFGNFPMMQGDGPGFDALLTANVTILTEIKPR